MLTCATSANKNPLKAETFKGLCHVNTMDQRETVQKYSGGGAAVVPRRIFFWLRQKLQCFALRPSGDGKMLVVEPDELLNIKIRIFSKSGDPYGNPLPAGKATAVAAYHRHAAKSRLSIPVRKTRKKRSNPKGLLLFLCFHDTIDEIQILRKRTSTFVITSRKRSSPTMYSNASSAVS